MDLAFVPRKDVPAWKRKGYSVVPGNPTPGTWAVLMQKASARVELPAIQGPRLSNRSAGARSRREREAALA